MRKYSIYRSLVSIKGFIYYMFALCKTTIEHRPPLNIICSETNASKIRLQGSEYFLKLVHDRTEKGSTFFKHGYFG